MDPVDLELAASWLVDSGYAYWAAMSKSLGITPSGVALYEQAAREADGDTPPPTVLLTNVERAEVEVLQRTITLAIEEYRRRPDADPDVVRELDADERTLAEAMRSPRTRREVVLGVLRGFAFCALQVGLGAAGNAAWALAVKLAAG